MMRTMAKIFGFAFLAAGILGFVPGITYNGYLMGIFHVNWLHNIVHLLTGSMLLWASYRHECTTMRVWQALAVVYGLVALLGLVFYNSLWIGPLAMNIPDTLLHLATTGVALYYGFAPKYRRHLVCPAT